MKSFQPSRETFAEQEPNLLPQVPQEALGRELKSMFDSLTAGPLPPRLLELADALEEAFQRGELFERPQKLDS